MCTVFTFSCKRQRTFFKDFVFTFVCMLHSYDNFFCTNKKIHSAAHACYHFPWNLVVCNIAFFINLHSTKNRNINMSASDQTERSRTIEKCTAGFNCCRCSACICNMHINFIRIRCAAKTDKTVL